MKISHTIDPGSTGGNTVTENARYVAAVQAAVQTEYPDADIDVHVSAGVYGSSATRTDNDNYVVADRVNRIANEIWDRADY